MKKRKIIHQIALWAGNIDIILQHQKPESWKEEFETMYSEMADLIGKNSNEYIYLSGQRTFLKKENVDG